MNVTARIVAFLVLGTLPLFGQSVRPYIQIDDPVDKLALGFSMTSAADTTAVVYSDLNDDSLRLVLSDGRGLDWSDPLRIDLDLPGVGESAFTPAIVDGLLYLAYRDRRLGTWECFLRVYNLGTGALGSEVRIDSGYAPGAADVWGWDMVATSDGATTYVHFLFLVGPASGPDELRILSSSDGGITFGASQQLSGNGVDVDAAFDLAADGAALHIAWADNRFAVQGGDLFYQRSTDGGVSFPTPDVQLDSSGPGIGSVDRLRIAVADELVCIAWNESVTQANDPEVRAIVSTDGGETFASDRRIDSGTVGSLSDTPITLDPDSGAIAVGWEDAGVLQGGVYVASSLDAGLGWSETQVSSVGGTRISTAEVAAHVPDGKSQLAFGYQIPSLGQVASVLSLDGGASWRSELIVSNTPPTDFSVRGGMAYNARYDNYIHVWARSSNGLDHHLFAGGYRPATLTAVQSDAPGLNFELSDFSGGAPLGGVLVAATTGTFALPFGDSRDIGLGVDALFLGAFSEIFGLLGAPLAGGAGSTPIIPDVLPPGLSIRAVGISFDLSGAVTIDQITDVIEVSGS